MAQKHNPQKENKCYIKDEVFSYDIEAIRNDVCVKGLPLTEFDDGNYYCLFHLPTKDKDIIKFEELFSERLSSIKNKIASIKNLSKNEQKEELSKISYDFSGVWFPNKLNFNGFKFEAPLIFKYSSFSEKTDFQGVVFESLADFSKSIFYQTANFDSSQFCSAARFLSVSFAPFVSFNNTTFERSVEFRWAIFNGDAYFGNVTFPLYADFTETTFCKYTIFSFSKFEEDSQVFFVDTKYKAKVLFNYTIFKGYVYFEGKQENPVFIGSKSLLDLQKARIENSAEISFHTVRLEAKWFVNTDSRKFNFIDCKWCYCNGDKLNARTEIKDLKIRQGFFGELIVETPNPILAITCRQLAENAETNNRFEEASNFRRMAMEVEWIEKKEKISNWINNLVLENEKLKRRVGGSTDKEDKPNPPMNTFGIIRRSSDFIIHGLYRITSFYGESWSWAAFVLLTLILIVFPFVYTQTDFYVCSIERTNPQNNSECITRTLSFGEGIRQSLATATLQNVESRKPNSPASETFTILEKIFAPLQAALLALAIRRKFMR